MNFTLRALEVWGEKERRDPLGHFFSNLFQESIPVDITKAPYQPTWKNLCTSRESITKSLDRFWIDDSLIGYMGRYRTWVEHASFSDHSPIILELDHVKRKSCLPFKFNHSWLKDKDCIDLVRLEWKKMDGMDRGSTMKSLVTKLRTLKNIVAKWEKERKMEMQKDLVSTENQIKDLQSIYMQGIYLEAV